MGIQGNLVKHGTSRLAEEPILPVADMQRERSGLPNMEERLARHGPMFPTMGDATVWLSLVKIRQDIIGPPETRMLNLKEALSSCSTESLEKAREIYRQEIFYTGGQTTGIISWIILLADMGEDKRKSVLNDSRIWDRASEERLSTARDLDKDVILEMVDAFMKTRKELDEVLDSENAPGNPENLLFVQALRGEYPFEDKSGPIARLWEERGKSRNMNISDLKARLSRAIALGVLLDFKVKVEKEYSAYGKENSRQVLRLYELSSMYNLIPPAGVERFLRQSLTVGIDRATQDLGDLWLKLRFPKTFKVLQQFLVEHLGEFYAMPPYELYNNLIESLGHWFPQDLSIDHSVLLAIASRKGPLSLLEKVLNRLDWGITAGASGRNGLISDEYLARVVAGKVRDRQLNGTLSTDLLRVRLYFPAKLLEEVLRTFIAHRRSPENNPPAYLRRLPFALRILRALKKGGLQQPPNVKIEFGTFITVRQRGEGEQGLRQNAEFIPIGGWRNLTSVQLRLTQEASLRDATKPRDKVGRLGGMKGDPSIRSLVTHMWFVHLPFNWSRFSTKVPSRSMSGTFSGSLEVQLVQLERAWQNSIGLAVWHMLRHKALLHVLSSGESWANDLLRYFRLVR